MSELEPTPSQFLIYRDEAGSTRIGIRFEDEVVLPKRAQIVERYESSNTNISKYFKNVIAEGELGSPRTVRKFRTVGRRDRTHKDCLSVGLAEGPTFSGDLRNGGQQSRGNARVPGQKADSGRRPLSARRATLRTTVSTIGKRRLLEEAGRGAL